MTHSLGVRGRGTGWVWPIPASRPSPCWVVPSHPSSGDHLARPPRGPCTSQGPAGRGVRRRLHDSHSQALRGWRSRSGIKGSQRSEAGEEEPCASRHPAPSLAHACPLLSLLGPVHPHPWLPAAWTPGGVWPVASVCHQSSQGQDGWGYNWQRGRGRGCRGREVPAGSDHQILGITLRCSRREGRRGWGGEGGLAGLPGEPLPRSLPRPEAMPLSFGGASCCLGNSLVSLRHRGGGGCRGAPSLAALPPPELRPPRASLCGPWRSPSLLPLPALREAPCSSATKPL